MAKNYIRQNNIICVISNLLLVYVLMMVTRIVFFCCNTDLLGSFLSSKDIPLMLKGAFIFDTSAICYINSLWILLFLIPYHPKENPKYYLTLRPLFVITNGIALSMNLIDCVYYRYAGKRTSIGIFNEFDGATNLTGALLPEVIKHWYLVLLFFVMLWLLWRFYRYPREITYTNLKHYYIKSSLYLVVAVAAVIIGIRGITMPDRPINAMTANVYVTKPVNTSLILNTPFTFIRSMGHHDLPVIRYMSDEEASAIFNPQQTCHKNDSLNMRGKNVVILLLESMSSEFMGSYLPSSEKGYTPFLDSIASQSLRFENMFANGRVSVDAMPSIMASMPMMNESLFRTNYANTKVKSLPMILNQMGYHTMFMHGALNTSMNFYSYMSMIGVKQYVGMDEYCKSDNPAFNGKKDFGNEWGIWDDKMLLFDLDVLKQVPQPFFTMIFTLTLHPPHKLPEYYTEQNSNNPKIPFIRSIRYTDWALRKFFEQAEQQDWYRNTLFVITADHRKGEYIKKEVNNSLGYFSIPLLFYTPDGSIAPGVNKESIVQQTDIMPTIMGMMGYEGEMVSFGCDIFNTPISNTWAFQYNNGIYQYEKGDYMIEFDGDKTTAVYAWRTDKHLQKNLLGRIPEQKTMERELKAIIQQYLSRVTKDEMLPSKSGR